MQRMYHWECVYFGGVVLIVLSKLYQHDMNGRGPYDKLRLLSCTIPYDAFGVGRP
jgi:hypothetical protein